ncbi:TorD/DmsD family molecular chaperone [Rhodospirillum rubrum]|uniref:TorD/DmsD family molecular chaperone n=1 Tax=Rhodospirillum rubrum TaxID=1085 RepID=UPI001903E9CB|nr:molecular chaperone TorD family protein [Rhodospirillum rubrum]
MDKITAMTLPADEADVGQAALFLWFAKAFGWPDAELVASLRGAPRGRPALPELLGDLPGAEMAVARIKEILDSEADDAALLAQLQRAHGALFEGFGGLITVPPYESAFAGGEARLFGAPTRAIEEILARLDLRVAEATSEPADHICVELNLLAHLTLSGKEAASDRQGLLDNHLRRWLPDFVTALHGSDRLGFHAACGDLLILLIDAEA